MILNIQAVFSCHVCIAAGQLMSSSAEHNGRPVSHQSPERARRRNTRDGGFERASTSCSKLEAGAFVINSCVFRECNLLPCPQLARSPVPRSTPCRQCCLYLRAC